MEPEVRERFERIEAILALTAENHRVRPKERNYLLGREIQVLARCLLGSNHVAA